MPPVSEVLELLRASRLSLALVVVVLLAVAWLIRRQTEGSGE